MGIAQWRWEVQSLVAVTTCCLLLAYVALSNQNYNGTTFIQPRIYVDTRNATILNGNNEGIAQVDNTVENEWNFPFKPKWRNHTRLRQRLANLRELLKPFNTELQNVYVAQQLQTGSNTTTSTTSQKKPLKLANAYAKDYFDVLNIPSVTTLFINVTKDAVLRQLETTLYDVRSNDCSDLVGRGYYPGGLPKAACSTLTESIETNIKDEDFRHGLPENCPYIQGDNVILNYIHIITNGTTTVDGNVYVNNVKISPMRCQPELNLKKFQRFPVDKGNIYRRVFSIALFWGEGFYHSTNEQMPRIAAYLQFLRENKDVKIHTHNKASFVTEQLRLLGIDPSRIITGTISANTLYIPGGVNCGTASVFNLQLLSMELRATIDVPPPEEDNEQRSIVVIKRSSKRYFKYHDDIYKMIQDVAKGTSLKVELFSDKHMPPMVETMKMFNRAAIVIGPHGAGESNMITSEPGTVIIEGQCLKTHMMKYNLCYGRVAKFLGHKYYANVPPGSCLATKPSELRKPLEFFVKAFQQEFEKGLS